MNAPCRTGISSHTRRLLLSALALVAGVVGNSQANELPRTREELVRWLRQAEDKVRTAYCKYEVRAYPTPPEIIPLVRELKASFGPNLPLKFVIDEASARQRSYIAEWWRDGAKVRLTKRPLFPPVRWLLDDICFDGQVVRTLRRERNHTVASIDSPEGADWYTLDRMQPTSLLYHRCEKPYSEIVAKSPNVVLQRMADGQLQVKIKAPITPHLSHLLVFDSSGRLVRRDHIGRQFQKEPTVFLRFRFSNYKVFKDPYGQTIEFPLQARISGFMGRHKNGMLLETATELLRIHEIRFNVDVPGEVFVLRIPRDATVRDGLTGAGWLEPGVRPAELFPEEAKKASRWWIAVLSVAIVVLFIATVVYLRRRFKPAPSGNGS